MRTWRVLRPFNLGGLIANPNDPTGEGKKVVTDEELSASPQPLAVTIDRLQALGCIVELTEAEAPTEEPEDVVESPGPAPRRTSTVTTGETGGPKDEPGVPTVPPPAKDEPPPPDVSPGPPDASGAPTAGADESKRGRGGQSHA